MKVSFEQYFSLYCGLIPTCEAEKAAFYEMANVFPEVDPCAGIFMTNSFDMVGAALPSCGMYLVQAAFMQVYRANLISM